MDENLVKSNITSLELLIFLITMTAKPNISSQLDKVAKSAPLFREKEWGEAIEKSTLCLLSIRKFGWLSGAAS